MRYLTSPSELDAVCALPHALLFKHSTRCPVSSVALREVESYADAHPDVPIVIVDVIMARNVARAATARFQIPHASPQAIMLVGGEPTWNASHFAVTVRSLSDASAAAAQSGDAGAVLDAGA